MPPRQNSMAQDVPTAFYQLDAGMFRNVPSQRIPENGCYDAQNVVFYEGRVRPRPPFVVATAIATGSAIGCNHVGLMQTQGGSQFIMRSEIDTGTLKMDVYYYDAAWFDITAPQLDGDLDHMPWSTQFKGEWLFCPGNDELYSWAASGNMVTVDSRQADTTLRPPDKPYVIACTATRVFLGNVVISGTRIPWRVCWSDTGSSIVWAPNGGGYPAQGSASYQDILHDSSEITGLFFQGGKDMICFKRTSIYKGIWKGGPVWYDFEPISMQHGCPAGQTIRSWRNTLIWLGDDFNVYAMPLRGQITAIGDAISPRLRVILRLSYVKRSSAVVDSTLGLYWLFVPQLGQTTVNKIFVCNLKTGAWAEGEIAGSVVKIMCAMEYRPGYSDPVMYFGSADGKIYEFATAYTTLKDGMSTGSGGTAYEAYVWGRVLDFLEVFKQVGAETGEFHALGLQAESGKATPQCRVGDTTKALLAATSGTYTEIDMDAATPVPFSPNRTNMARFGQVGVKWTSGQASPMPVDGVTIWSMPRSDAR